MGDLGSYGYKRWSKEKGNPEMTLGSGLGVWRCPLRQGALGEGSLDRGWLLCGTVQ